MSIEENVKRIKDEIGEAAIKAGKAPDDILLVAATKMNDAERVRRAISAGIRAAGENRVQELVEKHAQNAYDGAQLHFIGHLQKNKVKNVVGVCDLIQSVDSVELLEQISKRAKVLNLCQRVLIEVNIGRESAKSGVLPEQLDEILSYASGIEAVRVEGLMAIPPVSDEISKTCNYFDDMYKLFVDMRAKKYDNVYMWLLSMGMSHDYIQAIQAGANIVRVGTAIFGQRHYI